MKSLYIISICLVCIQNNLSSQGWLPIGSQWNFISRSWGQPIPDDIYTIVGTETILGKKCCVLKKSYASCDLRPNKEYMFKENGKLYYFDDELQDFLLLHDFSAQTGDIVKIPSYPKMKEYTNRDTSIIRIDSISEIRIGDLSLKKFHVSHGYYNLSGILTFGTTSNVIIEDIGSVDGFFDFLESGFCDGAYSYPLRSFFIPEFGRKYLQQEICYNHQLNENKVCVFPNPINDYITVRHIPDEVKTIKLINNLGQICASQEKREGFIFVNFNVSDYFKGVYYIVLTNSENDIIETIKIVKPE